MDKNASLTTREAEITELSAWGATKKEIADHLFISVRTVENHFRNIYDKTGCNRKSELSAWWFCTRFKIPFSLSPLRNAIMSIFMLLIVTPQIYSNEGDVLRIFRTQNRTCRIRTNGRRRNKEEEIIAFENFNL